MKKNTRTRRQLTEHYRIEKKLAEVLGHASKNQRSGLYSVVYDELYRSVPNHPQLTLKADSIARTEHAEIQLRVLKYLLSKKDTFLEIGAGDCSLSLEVAKRVKNVYAVDISKEITFDIQIPNNMKIIISDGATIPVPKGSIDVAYSNQLIEHLHPDDALDQVHKIYDLLREGGLYICITPNRLNGPHDISRYFDRVATGLHLKEYTITELNKIFKNVGFKKVQKILWLKGLFILSPILPFKWFESMISRTPENLKRQILQLRISDVLLNVKMVATK